jgi:hypothetical protein
MLFAIIILHTKNVNEILAPATSAASQFDDGHLISNSDTVGRARTLSQPMQLARQKHKVNFLASGMPVSFSRSASIEPSRSDYLKRQLYRLRQRTMYMKGQV